MGHSTINGQVLLKCLPAAYQEDAESRAFLEKFLGVFGSQLDESERLISDIPSYFDPLAIDPPNGHEDFTSWLATWLSLDLYELLGKEKNREYILKATEFYKQKGTLQGLTNLVTFLIGRKCIVKENVNNVFRSYGMEHCNELDPEQDYTKFPRQWSRTADKSMLAGMGTYNDKIHYTCDSSSGGRYSPYSVDIYLIVLSDEMFDVPDKYKQQLYKIIESFIPVFMKVSIRVVVLESETYRLGGIDRDENGAVNYQDHMTTILEEITTLPNGSYSDVIPKRIIDAYQVGGDEINNAYRSNRHDYWIYMTLQGNV
jgi:phage tail-like protein